MLTKIINLLGVTKQKPESAHSFLLENLPHVVFELDSEYRWVFTQ